MGTLKVCMHDIVNKFLGLCYFTYCMSLCTKIHKVKHIKTKRKMTQASNIEIFVSISSREFVKLYISH